MAIIGTGDAVLKFSTQADLDNTSSAVTSTSFSVAADSLTLTNTDDALGCGLVLECTFSVAPDANSSVALFLQALNIEGVNDAPIPTANFQHDFRKSFPVKDQTAIQRIPIDITFPKGKSAAEYQPFIQNNAGQTISAGWRILRTLATVGSKA